MCVPANRSFLPRFLVLTQGSLLIFPRRPNNRSFNELSDLKSDILALVSLPKPKIQSIMSSSAENNPWTSETSQRKDSINGSDPVSSTTNQGDGSKHDDSSPSPEPTGNGPRHTTDATSDKGLIPVSMEEERGRLGEPYMVNEDREFCKLFFETKN